MIRVVEVEFGAGDHTVLAFLRRQGPEEAVGHDIAHAGAKARIQALVEELQGFADGGLQLLSVTRFFPSSGWIHQHSAVLRIGTLIVDDRDSHPVECDERLLAHLGAFGSFTVLKKEGEKLLFCRAV